MVDANLEMRVALTFTATHLKNADLLSKSDPYLVLKDTLRGTVYGRTETVKNHQTLSFSKEIEMAYKFEEEQQLTLVAMDDDFGRSEDDFLGMAQFKLGTLMGSRGQSLKLQLMNKNGHAIHNSFVVVRAEQAATDDVATIALRARTLDNKDGFFSKSDPYFILLAADESSPGGYREIYKSEYIKNNLNPIWKPFEVPLRRITNKKLRIDVMDWDANSAHDMIGSLQLTSDELLARSQGLPVLHPPTKAKYKSSSYKNSGLLDVVDFTVVRRYSMIDYLRGGLQISLVVAVDFTGSNGDPSKPGSLHYGGGTLPNAYTEAMQGVGKILLEYDNDKMVPAFGFGALLRQQHQVSHCFPMSMGREEVFGIEGLMAAYRTAFQSGLSLSGPTYFSPVLRKAAAIARSLVNSYLVVLILTDGVLNDVNETIDAIVELSFLPISVVIVGVGSADFSQMKVLDADVNPLVSSQNVRAVRDCVQFVEFNRIGNNGTLLARDTLMELPSQLVQHMKRQNIAPSSPVHLREEDVTVAVDMSGFVPPAAGGPGFGRATAPQVVAPPPYNPASMAETGREIFRGAISM